MFGDAAAGSDGSGDAAARRDWPGAAVAAACVGLAVHVLVASAAFTRFGAVFPRAVAIAMLALSAALLVRALRPRAVAAAAGRGDGLARPLGLVAVLTLWVLLIPPAGFVAASLFGFFAAGLLARFEPWTARALAIHVATTALTVGALYLLFAHGLRVRFD